jgi:hypothetical protein
MISVNHDVLILGSLKTCPSEDVIAEDPQDPASVKDEVQTALFKRPSSYRAGNTFHFGYKNQSIHVLCGRIRCLF